MQQSNQKPQQKRQNKFFEDNAIKISISQSTPKIQIISHSSHQFSKNDSAVESNFKFRAGRSFSQNKFEGLNQSQFRNSLSNSNSNKGRGKGVGLNPRQFLHRDVFNTKLYQTATGFPTSDKNEAGQDEPKTKKEMKKYFKISLNIQDRQQSKLHLGQQIGQYFTNASKIIKNCNTMLSQQVQKQWKSIMHYLYSLQKMVWGLNKNQPLKLILSNTLNSTQHFIAKILGQLTQLKQYQRQQQLNITNLKRKKQIVGQIQLLKLQKAAKMQQQVADHHAIAKYKNKINLLDFQLKKQMLRAQKLQQQLTQANKMNEMLQKQNKAMKQQKQTIQKWRDDYEYKIRKLKEELEVAHIVKQQNLEDKFNYILGWKL